MLNDSQDPRSRPAMDGGVCMEMRKEKEKGDERGRGNSEEIQRLEEIEAIER